METGTGAVVEVGAIAASVKVVVDVVKLAVPTAPTWLLLVIIAALSLVLTIAAQLQEGAEIGRAHV